MRFLIFLLVPFLLFACTKDDTEWSLKVGDTIPSFEVVSNDGVAFNSKFVKDKPVAVVFFHTGCGDCQRELPVIQGVYNVKKGVVDFVLVSRAEGAQEIQDYWNRNSLSMPFCAQKDRTVYNLFANSRIPRIYLVSKSGIIVDAYDDRNMPDSLTLSISIEGLLKM